MYLVMKTETFAKLFFLISFTGLLMYAVLAFYTFHTAYTTMSDYENYHTNGLPTASQPPTDAPENEMKYILQWTTKNIRITAFGEGQEPFLKHECSYSNCYVTNNTNLLNNDYKNFDAVIFDVKVLRRTKDITKLPRHPAQKWVFHSMISANETPICLVTADSFFNWTWSYKLSSDIVTPFIEVIHLNGTLIAPKYNVHWLRNTSALTDRDIDILQTKDKAVAWIMDTCKERNNRMAFVNKLRNALKEHSLELDVLTQGCGKRDCPNDDCSKLIRQKYYYYLAYERSSTEDYVTEEVLRAYDLYAVPIVKGGADYTLFLPEDSYLDANRGNINKLASIIEHSIRNPESYYNFHRWRNHYIIKKANHMKGLCDLCKNLNSKSKVSTYSTYEFFRRWWNSPPLGEICFPKGAGSSYAISYMNSTGKPHINL